MTEIGIIGCGSISAFHHEGYAQAGARVAWAYDLRIEAVQAVAARYAAQATCDFREVLADKKVELVSVLTSASSHKEICLAAIAAGKGVVCEKTLTDNPVDSAEIARAAERAGVFFATAYMKRFFPAAQHAKMLLASMGRVISIHARTWQPFATLWQQSVPDELSPSPSPIRRTYGGGVLVCGGSHIINLIHWFSGRPTQVVGASWTRSPLDFDMQTNAMLWMPDGGIAHLETLWHPFVHVGYERNGWDERLEINTEQGRLDLYTVMWNEPEKNGALLVHQHAASGKTTEYRYPAVNPFHLEMSEMLRRFQLGEPASPSAWDGYVVDEVIAAITRSAHSGAVVPVVYADESLEK